MGRVSAAPGGTTVTCGVLAISMGLSVLLAPLRPVPGRMRFAVESRAGTGALEAGQPEGFRRAERAGGPHALRGRLAGRPGEDRRGERVRVPAGRVHHCQRLAAGVGRRGYPVRADGLPGAGSAPPARDPPPPAVDTPAP